MGRHVEHERFSKKRDEDDSDMDSDEDEDFPTLSKKEKKMAKKILSQPVKVGWTWVLGWGLRAGLGD